MKRFCHVAGQPVILLLLLAGMLLGSIGCNAPGQPRSRVGALPFPGLFTLYSTADPQDLGQHGSGGLFGGGGADRGIIYTMEAGFVDIAHIRDTVDWTRYSARHVRDAIARGEQTLALRMKNLTWFHLTFHYPSDWDELSGSERQALVDELAIPIGQELAYLMMTWHEVLTWYGYRGTFFFDESGSAFTYDDILSHLVGITVAGEAMRRAGVEEGEAFDLAVTEVLDEAMRELGALPPEETNRAVAAVKGAWWNGGKPLQRQFDVGLDSGTLRPWLVPEVSRGIVPREFEIPRLGRVRGRDFARFYDVEIDSRASVTETIRLALPDRPTRFQPGRHLLAVIDRIREQYTEETAVMAGGR